MGRGGRYKIQCDKPSDDCEATGFTLYVENLLEILPQPERGKRIFISEGISTKDTEKLQSDGYTTIYALSEYGKSEEEARRLGCKFIYKEGKISEL